MMMIRHWLPQRGNETLIWFGVCVGGSLMNVECNLLLADKNID
jgi:hypothetical protein